MARILSTGKARLVCAILLVLTAPGLANAAQATFTIDSTQSAVTLSGTSLGAPLVEQGPGSLTSSFGGTVDVDLATDSIQFTGGSALDAAVSGDCAPLAGGDEGTAPADFEGAATLALGSAIAAVRDAVMDMTSDPLAISNDGFDSSGIIFVFPEDANSSLDYRVQSIFGPIADSESLAGDSGDNITTDATILTVGNLQTITIPMDTTFTFELLSPGDTQLSIQG